MVVIVFRWWATCQNSSMLTYVPNVEYRVKYMNLKHLRLISHRYTYFSLCSYMVLFLCCPPKVDHLIQMLVRVPWLVSFVIFELFTPLSERHRPYSSPKQWRTNYTHVYLHKWLHNIRHRAVYLTLCRPGRLGTACQHGDGLYTLI